MSENDYKIIKQIEFNMPNATPEQSKFLKVKFLPDIQDLTYNETTVKETLDNITEALTHTIQTIGEINTNNLFTWAQQQTTSVQGYTIQGGSQNNGFPTANKGNVLLLTLNKEEKILKYYDSVKNTIYYNIITSNKPSKWLEIATKDYSLSKIEDDTTKGNITIEKEVPVLDLQPGNGSGRLLKNANLSNDYGTELHDYDKDGNQVVLTLSAKTQNLILNQQEILHQNNYTKHIRPTQIGALSFTNDRILIEKNADLNDLKYLNVGCYCCASNDVAKTIKVNNSVNNLPTKVAFRMDVLPSTGLDLKIVPGSYSYIEQHIYDMSGNEFKRYISTVKGSSTITYGDWITELNTQSIQNFYKPYHVGTTAPNDHSILWIDTTDNTGGLKYYNGSEWIHVPVAWD